MSQRQCFSAGPFETIQSLIAAREALAPGAVDLAERETEALVDPAKGGTLHNPAEERREQRHEDQGEGKDGGKGGNDRKLATAGQVIAQIGHFLDQRFGLGQLARIQVTARLHQFRVAGWFFRRVRSIHSLILPRAVRTYTHSCIW